MTIHIGSGTSGATSGASGISLSTALLAGRQPYQRTNRKLVMAAPVSQVGFSATYVTSYGNANSTITRALDGSWIGTYPLTPASGAVVLPLGAQAHQVRFKGLGYPNSQINGGYRSYGPALGPFGTINNKYTFEVGHYGQYFSFVVLLQAFAGTPARYRLKVDGVYEQLASLPFNDANLTYQGVNRNFGSVAARHIEVEIYGGAWLSGLQHGSQDAMYLPPWRKTPQVYWIGDSFVVGSRASDPGFNDMVDTSMGLLGFDDYANDAQGGTGYLHINSTFPNYMQRANTQIAAGNALPEIVIVSGSINDDQEYLNLSTLSSNATALYAHIAAVVPNAKVAVVQFSNHTPPAGGDAGTQNRATIAAAANAAPNVVGVLDLSTQITGVSGGGVGTTDVILASDAAHPTQAGHDLYGFRIAQFLDQVL